MEKELALAELPPWLKEQTGRVLLLLAEAGEGKSTFTQVLCHRLEDSFVILQWDIHSQFPFDYQRLKRFHATLRTFNGLDSLPPEEPTLLVIGDARSKVDGPTADDIANSLSNQLEGPGPAIVLISGCPGELQLLTHRILADHITLLPLNEKEAVTICSNLDKAYRDLNQRGVSDAELKNDFPNLLRFLNLTRPQQIALFTSSQKPLLVALLEAVYGQECWYRIKKEFDSLPLPAQKAYLYICLASAAGEYASPALLRQLAAETAIDEYCQCNPWVRTDEGNHVARHRVIAQTVIEESKKHALIEECIEGWLAAAESGWASPIQTWHILDHIAGWSSVAPERPQAGKFKGTIQKLARDAIRNQKDSVANVKHLIKSDVRQLMQWASTIHELTPRPAQAEHLFLLESGRGFLEEARAQSPSDSLLQRIEYYLDKNARATKEAQRAKYEYEGFDEVKARVKKWVQLSGNRVWGPDFFADLFKDTYELARRLTVDAGEQVKPDSEAVFEAYLLAFTTFEKLSVQTGYDEKTRGLDVGKYSELNRLVHAALPTRYLNVLRAAWEVSASTSTPNPKTAVHYAKGLPPDEARHVLKETLKKRPDWGEAQLRLALLVKTDEQRTESQEFIQTAFAIPPSGLYLAFLNHAAGWCVEGDDSQRERFYREAVLGYSLYVKSERIVDARREVLYFWELACTELRKLTPDIPTECGEYLAKEKNRIRHDF